MIGQSKPLASLSSTLLARKGQARPAMRAQGFAGFGPIGEAVDDLGWNDMGVSDVPSSASIRPIAPELTPENLAASVPPVLVERDALSSEFNHPEDRAEEAAPAPVIDHIRHQKRLRAMPVATLSVGQRAKAAFTLRLDGDRHLRLRLASALRNRSAQALVTEALDAFLASLPEIDEMVGRVAGHG
jgi:hypothetical protein